MSRCRSFCTDDQRPLEDWRRSLLRSNTSYLLIKCAVANDSTYYYFFVLEKPITC
jgi:hypothetical protein